uniref:replication initiation protein n=1 Tax=Lactococcus garvieae TaxID=1363 RepID=UPI00359C7BF6
MNNKKLDNAFEALISRQEYIVFQANDLAKAFGNLTTKQHKLFDFTTSFITKESTFMDTYETTFTDVLKHFGLSQSGTNYAYIAKSFKELYEKTNLIIQKGDSLILAKLFGNIDLDRKKGTITFDFDKYVLPYLVELKENFYAIELATLSMLKSKYSIILMKLWQANKFGNNPATQIKGSLEEWQEWFVGNEKKMDAGRFKAYIITRAAEELEKKLHVEIELLTRKNGRKVTGYEMTIREPQHYSPMLKEDIPFDFGEE